ncbi:MAG: quinone oxidoreductase [Steroidobacteraceae bacterium]
MPDVTTPAVVIRETGGPEVLRIESIALPPPAEGEVQVRHTAIGLNFIDVYDRTGLYPVALPAVPGHEAAGVVTAVGRKVKGLRAGDRIAYALQSPGAYAQARNVAAARLVRLPKGVKDETAAAIMLKGLTAHYLLRRTYRVKKGDHVLVHAAAGGVGLLLTQWARALGARVIGIVGSLEKATLAKRHGCHHTLLSGSDDIVAEVKRLTKGAGVHVVYDSIGKDTFFESLDCLRPLGMMVSYGNTSGPPPAVSPLELAKRGSLFLTRPSLFTYVAAPVDLAAAARELFAMLTKKKLRVRIGQRYALAEAVQAHRDLEARRNTGSTVLVP